MFVVIGGYWGKHFGFTPLLDAFEVVSRTFPPSCGNMCSPIGISNREGNIWILRNYFKNIA
jgi:hypothetical protein